HDFSVTFRPMTLWVPGKLQLAAAARQVDRSIPRIQVGVRLHASHAGEVHGYTNDQFPQCEQPRRHLSGTKPARRRK
ncbi:hypothetical protein, partial [Pseudomonas sp. Snoq117.2]